MLLREILTVPADAHTRQSSIFADGWYDPEPGRRWTSGQRSSLALRGLAPDADHVLMMVVEPFAGIPSLPSQRLWLGIDDTVIRQAVLDAPMIFAARIPASLVAGRDAVDLALVHPDASSLARLTGSGDERQLALAFTSLTLFRVLDEPADGPAPAPTDRAAQPEADALSDTELMLRFASLGDNCEFGIAQRFAGAEPLNLLRFSNASLQTIGPALQAGFVGIDAAETVEIETRETLTAHREYVTCLRRYGMKTHAHVFENQMEPARMFARELKRLGLLRRLLLDDLRGARRIFVYKQNEGADDSAVRALADALGALGPNTLLHVTLSVPGDPASRSAGTVERLGPGLLRGWIDRFSTYDNAAARPSHHWVGICRGAYALWRNPDQEMKA